MKHAIKQMQYSFAVIYEKLSVYNEILNIAVASTRTSTICPRSSDQIYVLTNYIKWVTISTYYIKWVTISLTHSKINLS